MSNETLGVQLEVVAQHSEGYFGDPNGYEELLYSTKTANSFLLVGKGGYASKYSANEVRELTRKQAQEYLVAVKGEEEAYKIIPQPEEKPAAKAAAKPAAKAAAKPAAKAAAKPAAKTAAKPAAKKAPAKKATTTKPAAKKTETKK